MFEKRILRVTFGSEGKQVTGAVCSEVMHDLGEVVCVGKETHTL